MECIVICFKLRHQKHLLTLHIIKKAQICSCVLEMLSAAFTYIKSVHIYMQHPPLTYTYLINKFYIANLINFQLFSNYYRKQVKFPNTNSLIIQYTLQNYELYTQLTNYAKQHFLDTCVICSFNRNANK